MPIPAYDDRAFRTTGLTLQLVWPAALALVLAAALFACIAYDATARALVWQVEQRAAVVLSDIARNVEARLNLGLRLAELSEVQDLLERERAKDEHVLSLEIFDGSGRIVFSTDRGLIGDPVPAAWLRYSAASRTLWTATDFEAQVIGAPIRNSFEMLVGAAVLRYSSGAFSENDAALLRRVAVATVLATVAALALLVLLSRQMLGHERRRLRASVALLARTTPGREFVPGPAEPDDVAAACRQLLTIDRTLHQVSADVQKLDDDA